MKPRIPSEALALVLVDELARNGIEHACIAPGARSTPVALALVSHPSITVHVMLDERSTSFLALGIAKATRKPAVVLCTSGTAAANFTPAVQEASRWRVPMIVLTADRPPELRATGANQTIDQIKMFGDAVRWFCEVGVPEGQVDERPNAYWRSVACRAATTASGSPPGPVHLNLAFREPLMPAEDAVLDLDLEGRASEAPWVEIATTRASADDVAALASTLRAYERGVIVVGATEGPTDALIEIGAKLGWPVLADPLSQARHLGGLCTYDLFLRDQDFVEAHRPDVVLRTGSINISKALSAYVAQAPRQILVDPDGEWLDADRSTTDLIVAEPADLLVALAEQLDVTATPGWLDPWVQAEAAVNKVIDDGLAGEGLSEPLVARLLVDALEDGSNLVVGASMPIRDVEWFGQPRALVSFYANRGANGIDGFVSTALGVALGSGRPTWGLCGDLTLLHDSNGLLGAHDADLTLVVINNDGGGIFSFLPQAGADGFEKLFGTPQGRDLAKLAAFHEIEHVLVEDRGSFLEAIRGPRGVRMVEVRTERDANVELHRTLNAKVAEAMKRLRHS